ncbi:MAG TPA: hypothetical protein DDW49_09975 [Deltaproteobacteria bacterium]|nr:MAG: hypothetical protein A2048_02720 [Deltaproteobacteria bacterium GWA2_45_12]HBF13691.1 hypothetical protein [Deltaproteobacteria bacterium]
MKMVTLKQLKEDLSGWAEKAAKGESIQVTKYNKPYITLVRSNTQDLHIGSRYGKGTLKCVIKGGLGGLSLKYLSEDRDGIT